VASADVKRETERWLDAFEAAGNCGDVAAADRARWMLAWLSRPMYRQIVRRRFPRLLGGASDTDEAVDAAMDFVFRRVAGFRRERAPFSNWAYRGAVMAIRCCVQKQRRRHRTLELHDALPDRRRDPEDWSAEISDLNAEVETLSSRVRFVLVHRFGLGGVRPQTAKAIGRDLGGITQQGVLQIEQRAIGKLRERMCAMITEQRGARDAGNHHTERITAPGSGVGGGGCSGVDVSGLHEGP
jgi:RNA polymerase sigma factor (sigma-70 family)